jgi:hypothetical protein
MKNGCSFAAASTGSNVHGQGDFGEEKKPGKIFTKGLQEWKMVVVLQPLPKGANVLKKLVRITDPERSGEAQKKSSKKICQNGKRL